jgi:hypothetical protein
MIFSYSDVKIYNATSSIVCFENAQNNFVFFEKITSQLQWCCSCKIQKL